MKLRNLFLFSAVLLLASCNKNEVHQEHSHAHQQEQEPTHNEEHDSAEGQVLSLNNGKKWVVDESTQLHGAKLVVLAENFEKQQDKTLQDYQNFGKTTDAELQNLIKACTMKGPDHEALHLWLTPILKQIEILKQSPDEQKAQESARELAENINKFNQFFN